jgi:hypothetical protein
MNSLERCHRPAVARKVNPRRRTSLSPSASAAGRTRLRVSTDAVVSAYLQEISHADTRRHRLGSLEWAPRDGHALPAGREDPEPTRI